MNKLTVLRRDLERACQEAVKQGRRITTGSFGTTNTLSSYGEGVSTTFDSSGHCCPLGALKVMLNKRSTVELEAKYGIADLDYFASGFDYARVASDGMNDNEKALVRLGHAFRTKYVLGRP